MERLGGECPLRKLEDTPLGNAGPVLVNHLNAFFSLEGFAAGHGFWGRLWRLHACLIGGWDVIWVRVISIPGLCFLQEFGPRNLSKNISLHMTLLVSLDIKEAHA